MLVLWTSDKVEIINRVLGKQLNNIVNQLGVDVRVEPFVDGMLPHLQEGEVALAMGGACVEVLCKMGLVPKNRTIGNLRLTPLTLPSGNACIVTYSPRVSDREYDMYVKLMLDLNLAVRRVKTGSYAPKLGNYQWVSDFTQAIEAIIEKHDATGQPVEVALDLETLGLNPYSPDGWIVTAQLSYKAGMAHVLHFGTQSNEVECLKQGALIREQLHWLLNAGIISLRGANLKYDLGWLWVRGQLECTNFKFDTMLVGSLLDENRGNSLNLHTKWYIPELGGYDDPMNTKYDKSRMDLIPRDDLLPYAGGDTDACLQVSKVMKQELLSDTRLARFYVKILHPAARAYEHVERTGMLVDIPYYMELEDEIQKDIRKLEQQAFKIMGGRMVARHADNLNLLKPSLLLDFMFSPRGLNLTPKMFTEKTKKPSTSIDHMLMFKDDPRATEFIKVLEEYSSATKTLSTFVCKRDEDGYIVGGFLSHLRTDGRFHPTNFLFNGTEDDGGTNTGRLSVRDPAMQTIPKHTDWAKRLRRAFIAPDGYLILSNDYSQGELKIAACLANEQTMIDSYRNGVDLHAVTAARLAGWDWDAFMKLKDTDPDTYDEIRQLGKAGNFGLIYGMGAEGYRSYAGTSYGVTLTSEEAENHRNAFFELYHRLPEWHRLYKAMARKNLQISSPLGRVRHLPLITSLDREMASKEERRSVNAPVQSTLSDLSIWATALMHRAGWSAFSPVFGMVHDQLLSYIPEENAEMYAARNKFVMENLPFHLVDWEPQLQFTVDCEMGKNLGELKKYKDITYDKAGYMLDHAKQALAAA